MVCRAVTFHSEDIFAGLRRVDNTEVNSKAFDAHLWVNMKSGLSDCARDRFFEWTFKSVASQSSRTKFSCFSKIQ